MPVKDPTPAWPAWIAAAVFATQGTWVRRRVPRLPAAHGPHRGRYGSGPILRLLALGDSIIAGVGVATALQALPAQVARKLADGLACRVDWEAHGENGARTQDLLVWLDRAHPVSPDLIVVSNGLNDLTALLGLEAFLQVQGRFYDGLLRRYPDSRVLQLGLPPLGYFPALPQPLRSILGQRAEVYDRALAALLRKRPRVSHLPFTLVPGDELFASDGYHPNARGIGIWAEAVAAYAAGLAGLPCGNELRQARDER